MKRYVFVYKDGGQPDFQQAKKAIQEVEGARVVDESHGKIMLVEIGEEKFAALKSGFSGWIIEPEKFATHPIFARLSIS